MNVLAIDTSTTKLVVGVCAVDAGAPVRTLADLSVEDSRHHNELLTPLVIDALAAAGLSFSALDAVVVGEGPGPFTGLRVGMASAQAFADALSVSVFGVMSLDALAHAHSRARAHGGEETPAAGGRLVVATDARRHEVYVAAYKDGERVAGPDVEKPETLTGPYAEADIVCAPPQLAEKMATVGERTTAQITPASLCAVADFEAAPRPLRPHYLRRPDAVLPKDKPRSKAIPDVEI